MQKHNLLGGAGNKDVIHIRNCVLLRRHDDRNKLPSAALSPPAAAADEVDDVRGEMWRSAERRSSSADQWPTKSAGDVDMSRNEPDHNRPTTHSVYSVYTNTIVQVSHLNIIVQV